MLEGGDHSPVRSWPGHLSRVESEAYMLKPADSLHVPKVDVTAQRHGRFWRPARQGTRYRLCAPIRRPLSNLTHSAQARRFLRNLRGGIDEWVGANPPIGHPEYQPDGLKVTVGPGLRVNVASLSAESW